MKNSTAKFAKVIIIALTIGCMMMMDKVSFIHENPVVSILAGVALAVVMGNLMTVVSRKQREHAAN